MRRTERQSKKVTKRSSDDKRVKIRPERLGKVKNILVQTAAVSGVLQTQSEFAFQLLKVAMRKLCIVNYISFLAPEDLCELETGPVLHQDMNLVQQAPLYNTRKEWSQTSSTQDVFCEKNTKNSVRFMSGSMASGAHGHILGFNSMFFHRNKPQVGNERW